MGLLPSWSVGFPSPAAKRHRGRFAPGAVRSVGSAKPGIAGGCCGAPGPTGVPGPVGALVPTIAGARRARIIPSIMPGPRSSRSRTTGSARASGRAPRPVHHPSPGPPWPTVAQGQPPPECRPSKEAGEEDDGDGKRFLRRSPPGRLSGRAIRLPFPATGCRRCAQLFRSYLHGPRRHRSVSWYAAMGSYASPLQLGCQQLTILDRVRRRTLAQVVSPR